MHVYRRGLQAESHSIALANSDPVVVQLADRWIRRFSQNKVTYTLQHHADQDPMELIEFWASHLGVNPAAFSVQRKSNSGQLNGRTWRSKWGVLSVRTCDTQLRARLQAWIDRVKESWFN